MSRPSHIAVRVLALLAVVGCSADVDRAVRPVVPREGAALAPLLAASAQTPDSDARYIVVLKDNVANSRSLAARLATAHASATHHIYENAVRGFAATLSPRAVAALRANSSVAYIELDRKMYVDNVDYTPGWGLDRIDQRTLPLNRTFDSDYNGTGVKVYIVDTGVLASQADFGGRVTRGYSTSNGLATAPCNAHGTDVAGVAAGYEFGVAKNATIVPVRGSYGCDGWGWVSSWTAAIDWVIADHTTGPAVLNFSYSTPEIVDNLAPGSMSSAVKRAKADGIFVVVSAGNNSGNACAYSPANVSDIVTVGATNDADRIASFSNFGSCVDLFAPGEGISTAQLAGGYYAKSGTSFSAPMVAGVGALLLQRFPNDPPERIRNMIVNGASHAIVFANGNGAASPNLLLYSNVPSVPTVSIQGPSYVGWSNSPCLWQAVIEGGRDPYTFQWSGLKTGNLSSVSGPLASSGAFSLDIWDALGQHASATPFFVNVDSFNPGYTICTGAE